MEKLLSILRETAIFMLVAQMILHFGPGKKYEKYGRMSMALVVLSLLVVPLLSLGGEQWNDDFWSRLDELEVQNRFFTQELERLDGIEAGFSEAGLLCSVEEKIAEEAGRAGVCVEEVKTREGMLVILVRALHADRKEAEKGKVTVEKVGIQRIAAGGRREVEGADAARAAAFRGKYRMDLAERFSAALQMDGKGVEVIELE